MRLNKSAAVAAFLLLYSSSAAAQLTFHDPVTNQGILDQVVTQFATRAASWQSIVMNAAMWLFWTLGTISLAWTGVMMILRKADIGEFFAEFVRFILFFGFFLWLLRNGPNFASSIIQSLRQIGENAIGISGLSPSGIVDVGVMIFKQAVSDMSSWHPIDTAVGMALSVGILVLLAIIGVNMLLLLVSGWILMYAGIFFLGFGGSRWTSDMAVNYYKTVLGVAVQLFTMVLLIGIGNDLLTSFYGKMTAGKLRYEELGVMLVFCVALLILANKVPMLLSGIITGASVGHAGIGNFGAGAAIGAAGMAAAAAATGGAMLAAGAANIGGGGQALMAAFSKAGEGTNAMGCGDAMGGMLGGGIGGRGGSSGDKGTGNTPFAEAAGFAPSARNPFNSMSLRKATSAGQEGSVKPGAKGVGGGSQQSSFGSGPSSVAKVGTITAAAAMHLAKGAAKLVGDKIKSQVAETTGGKIAAAIKAQGASVAGTDSIQPTAADSPSFANNSLSGDDFDPESEVAAFVNRNENK